MVAKDPPTLEDALAVVGKLRADLRKSKRDLRTATKLLLDMRWAFVADFEANSSDTDWPGNRIWSRLERFLAANPQPPQNSEVRDDG